MCKRRNRVLHGVINDVLDLELVFVISMRVGELAELLRQLEAVSHCFGRHKVLGHFDATMQIADLYDDTQTKRLLDELIVYLRSHDHG